MQLANSFLISFEEIDGVIKSYYLLVYLEWPGSRVGYQTQISNRR